MLTTRSFRKDTRVSEQLIDKKGQTLRCGVSALSLLQLLLVVVFYHFFYDFALEIPFDCLVGVVGTNVAFVAV